jgi:S-formylglutathione hydrolase FrmB
VGHVRGVLGRPVAGVVGHSKGATAALLYAAAHDGDVPAVVCLAGRADVSAGVTRRLGTTALQQLGIAGAVEMRGRSAVRGEFAWTLTQADLDARLKTDVLGAAACVRDTAILIVHGDADTEVPVSDAHALDAALTSVCAPGRRRH